MADNGFKTTIDVAVPSAGFAWLRSMGNDAEGTGRLSLATGLKEVLFAAAQ